MMGQDITQSDVHAFVAEVADRNKYLLNLLPRSTYTLMIFQPITLSSEGPTREIVEAFAQLLNNQKRKYHLEGLHVQIAEETGPPISFGEEISVNTIYKIVIY